VARCFEQGKLKFGASLKTGNIWNYRAAVIYCGEESVSHGWLSTSTDKKSSVNARQTTGCRNEKEEWKKRQVSLG
jgi:hypothetical protein